MACHSVRNPRTRQTATAATAFSEYENSPVFFRAITDEANGHESGEIFNPPAEKACVKKGRKRKAEEDITLANLEPYKDVLPLESAAKMFGVGRTTFRTRIRKLGIEPWPYKRSIIHNPVREIIDALFMDDDIYHEMNYQGNKDLNEMMQEFEDLIR